MRYGMLNTDFDLSDVVDTIDDILDIAGEVIEEHAPDPGLTRIERLARWIAASVDPAVTGQSVGQMAVFRTSRVHVIRSSDRVTLDLSGRTNYSAEEAREIAAALLRAAELADGLEA